MVEMHNKKAQGRKLIPLLGIKGVSFDLLPMTYNGLPAW